MATDMEDTAQGWEVFSGDDQKIGKVAEVHPDYLLVEKGFLFKKDLYIPTSAIRDSDPANECIYLNVYKDQIDDLRWDEMPTTTGRTGAVGMATTADRPAEAGSVELREEQLRAAKTSQEAGSVEIGKRVVSEEQTLDVPVTRDEVHIERRAVDRRPADEIDEDDSERIRVPLNEEQVEVEKRPVVTEEINIRKTPVTENRRVTETVQREEPVIDKEGTVTEHQD